MKPEEKDLLLKDLSARLPYETKVYWANCNYGDKVKNLVSIDEFGMVNDEFPIEECKPFLRPMSSMTEKEKLMFYRNSPLDYYEHYFEGIARQIEWFNAHHFDYRGLIDKGLAFEVTEEYNPYKE